MINWVCGRYKTNRETQKKASISLAEEHVTKLLTLETFINLSGFLSPEILDSLAKAMNRLTGVSTMGCPFKSILGTTISTCRLV